MQSTVSLEKLEKVYHYLNRCRKTSKIQQK